MLGLLLAFIAGSLNAGGFLIVAQYTSHMSGMVSTVADDLVLGLMQPLRMALAGIGAFLCGAITCSLIVNWARRRNIAGQYALPLLLEGILILGFAAFELFTSNIPHRTGIAIIWLCFIMGLQNATITKASGARIRTTHVTGITTDIGIELGKLVYGLTDMPKLTLLTGLLACFFCGGAIGALGFKTLGPVFAIPFGLLLLIVALPPLLKRFEA